MTYQTRLENKMTNLYRFSQRAILLLASLFILTLPINAKDNKKKAKVEVRELNEPDNVCHKAKPDRHPHKLELPQLAFLSMRGTHGLEGYDISHHNGRIDWKEFSSDPHCGYVFIKSTEGESFFDNTYEYNLNEARKYGVKVGTYHFFRANVPARVQFENFSSHFDPKKQDLLPVVDVETMPRGISQSRFEDCLEDFCILIEKAYGRRPLIYSGKYFYNKYLSSGRFAKYKFWIATYSDTQPVLKDNFDYLIWQNSDNGRAKGVKTRIDTNRFVGRHVISEIKF